MNNTRITNRYGLTLVEVVVSSLLVGTVVVGALSMLGSFVKFRDVCNDLRKGPALADAMLAEIMALPCNDPDEDEEASIGLDSNEPASISAASNRMLFDDVDDYHGWKRGPLESPPSSVQDRTGSGLADYVSWKREVAVDWGRRDTGDSWTSYYTGLKRIIVTVTSPAGKITSRFGLRSTDGALEQQPMLDKVVITQIEIGLTVGSPEVSAQGIVNLFNHVEVPDGN